MEELKQVKNPWKDASFANNCNPPDKRMSPDDYPEMLGMPIQGLPFDASGATGMTFLGLDDVKPSSYGDYGNNVPVISGDQVILEKHWERRGKEIHFKVGNVRAKSGFMDAKGHYRISNTKVLHKKGTQNIFAGESAGNTSLTGADNVCAGYNAGNALTSSPSNTLIGSQAGEAIAGGSGYNECIGYKSGKGLTTGSQNVCIGGLSGEALGAGSANTLIGVWAGKALASKSSNTIVGNKAGTFGDSANNSLFGAAACYEMTSGAGNTAVGTQAGRPITTGDHNIFLGLNAGTDQIASSGVTTGSNNIIIGYTAGKTLTTGDDNIVIGDLADLASSALTNCIVLGKSASASASNSIVLGGATQTTNIAGDLQATTGEFTSATAGLLGATRTTAGTNTLYATMDIKAETTGDMADNFGPTQRFIIEDDGGAENVIANFGARRDGNDTSGELVFQTKNSGATVEGLVVRATGDAEFSENVSIKSQKELRFYDNGNYVGFEAPALSADKIWVLPSADGNASEFLQTNGSGTLSWSATFPDVTIQDQINLTDGTDTHILKAVQETGLGGRYTIGLDETARTMVICDAGNIDTDLALSAQSNPHFYIFNADADRYTKITNNVIDLYDAYCTMQYSSSEFQFKTKAAEGFTFEQFTTDIVAGHLYKFISAASIELTDDNAEQAWMYLEPKINQAGAGGANYVGFLMDVTETQLDSGTNELMALRVSGTDKFTISNSGTITVADGGSISLQEDITFTGATTENLIKFPDNLLDALSIQEGANKYVTFVTVDNEEDIVIYKSVDILHTATHADDHALEIDTDAAMLGDVKAIDVDYITGQIDTGQDEGIILINIDETIADGGDVFGVEVLSTDGLAGIYGMKAGAVVNPIHQDSGTFVNPDTATDNTTSGKVANMSDGNLATTTAIFDNNSEYIIIGATAAAFEEMEFIITTSASGAGIKPTFWYSTAGAGTFTEFTPVDGTDGLKHTGVVAWDASDLINHAVNTDTSTYDIKVIRTRTSLTTSPVLGYAKVATTTEYTWDKDGILTIAGCNIGTGTLSAGAITGTSFIIGGNTLTTTEWANLDGLDQALKTTDAPGFATGVTIGNLTLANGSITDSSNAINFGNEALSTTGTLGCGNVTGGTYNALTLAAAATGFTIAGGSTSKTLTCDDNFVVSTQLTAIGANTTHRGSVGTDHGYIDQDLQTSASPSFTACSLGTGELAAGSINRASGTLTLEIGGTSVIDVLSTYVNVKQTLFINETASADGTIQLCINQAGNDDAAISLKSSDVGHGCTTKAETDTYAAFYKFGSDTGGLRLWGLGESYQGFGFVAYYTTDNVTKTSAARAPIEFDVAKIDGTGITTQGANANIFVVRTYSSTRFIVDEDGDILYDGTAGAYQECDDIALIADLEDSLSGKIKKDKIKDKDIYKKHKIIHNDNFISTKKKNMLLYGSIRQLDERLKVLEGA